MPKTLRIHRSRPTEALAAGPQPPAIQGASLSLFPVGLPDSRQEMPQKTTPCPNCAASICDCKVIVYIYPQV